MDCSPNNPWATGARHQQMAKCVISWEGTQQAHLYINRRRGSQQDVLGDEAWANEAAHALSWDLLPERCSQRFESFSSCLKNASGTCNCLWMHDEHSEMNMCEPNNNKPLERVKRWRLRYCFKPTANVTIPEMLKVVVPDPDLWPYIKPADFSGSSFGTLEHQQPSFYAVWSI